MNQFEAIFPENKEDFPQFLKVYDVYNNFLQLGILYTFQFINVQTKEQNIDYIFNDIIMAIEKVYYFF